METSYCFKVTGFQFLEKVKKKIQGSDLVQET